MKNSYFLFALLFLSATAFSQVEFAPAGAEWYYKNASGYTTKEFSYDAFSYLQYTGDAVFDGLTCKRICAMAYRSPIEGQPSCDLNAAVHFIYQRADSIFEYMPGTDPRSRFLFRNNYNVGDIVYDSYGLTLRVESVDTLAFNGQTVRRFLVSDGMLPPIACYDLFGPENGLFNYQPWLGRFIVDGGTVALRCYQDASFARVNLSNEACDSVLVSATPHIEVALLPNPVREELIIQINAFPWTADLRVAIYDAAGRFILEDRLNTSPAKIPVAHLSNGVYMCVFQDGNSIFHQKFVKN